MRALALALLLLAGAPGCQRPTPEQCERLCWRYNELQFWDAFEKEVAGLPPAEVERRRAERRKAWEEIKAREFDPGLENCVRDCRRGSDPDQAACVDKATTAAEARACLEE